MQASDVVADSDQNTSAQGYAGELRHEDTDQGFDGLDHVGGEVEEVETRKPYFSEIEDNGGVLVFP